MQLINYQIFYQKKWKKIHVSKKYRKSTMPGEEVTLCTTRIDAENLGERAFTTQFHNNLFRRKLIGRGSTSPRRFWRISLNIISASVTDLHHFPCFVHPCHHLARDSPAKRVPHVVNAIGLSFLTDFRARFDKKSRIIAMIDRQDVILD